MIKILLVDDDTAFREPLKTVLEDNGYSVTESNNGVNALRILGDEFFDLAIIDVIMPDMNGVELILKIKEMKLTIKLIAISGGGNFITVDECLNILPDLGADSIIKKPFNSQQILDKIREVLG